MQHLRGQGTGSRCRHRNIYEALPPCAPHDPYHQVHGSVHLKGDLSAGLFVIILNDLKDRVRLRKKDKKVFTSILPQGQAPFRGVTLPTPGCHYEALSSSLQDSKDSGEGPDPLHSLSSPGREEEKEVQTLAPTGVGPTRLYSKPFS